MLDLERERDQVKVLEIGAAENDTKYYNLVKELESEKANKAELSEKLKLAVRYDYCWCHLHLLCRLIRSKKL